MRQGRSPLDDERDGLTGSIELKMKALSLRRKGSDAWEIAQAIGVSTATVIRWHNKGKTGLQVEEERRKRARAHAARFAEIQVARRKAQDDFFADFGKQVRRQGIVRPPVSELVTANNERYAHQRTMCLRVAGIKTRRPNAKKNFYAAPGMSVGVTLVKQGAGYGRAIQPKMVPWVHEFE